MKYSNMINNIQINKMNIIGMLYRIKHFLNVKKYIKNKILKLIQKIKNLKILFNLL